jgi:hypothetical protein
MAKDGRLYARFTLDFIDHPKIIGLSDAAFRTLFEMIIYSRRMLTDGFISRRLICDDEATKQKRSSCLWSASVCFDLLHNDDANPSLIEVENGYLIHDFAEHQTTRADLESVREARRTAGRKGGIASGQTRRANSKRSNEAKPKQNRSKTKPETETETDKRTKEPPYPPNEEPSPPPAPRRATGAEIARARIRSLPTQSVTAYAIAEQFSASLPVPIETGLLTGIGQQIDKCLKGEIPPPAIAAGLVAWTNSDSWSPTQIPNFVHKANNRTAPTNGKPTAKAAGYEDALHQLLEEVTTL